MRWLRRSPIACSARPPKPFTRRGPVHQAQAARRGGGALRRRVRQPPRRAVTPSTATRPRGLYKKLVIGEDGRLLGGILVGDASNYDTLRPLAGRARCRPRPSSCCCPRASAARPRSARTRCRTRRPCCSCHNVTKGAIATRDPRAGLHRRRPRSRRAPRPVPAAAPACRCSSKLLRGLRRADLEGAVRALRRRPARSCTRSCSRYGITTFASCWPSTARGKGDGCEVCKPAVASILASLAASRTRAPAHVLDGEQAALQDTNDHFLANLQRNGSYSVVPRIPGGEITPDKLIVIGEVARDFGLYTKITGGQRIDLFGARVEQLPQIWRRLVDAGFESGHAYGKALRTVKSLRRLDLVPLRRAGLGEDGHRAGTALPGPARAAQAQGGGVRLRPRVRRGAEQGLRRDRHRDTAGTCTSAATAASGPGTPTCSPPTSTTEELIRTIDRFLMFYIRTADRLERTASWIERIRGRPGPPARRRDATTRWALRRAGGADGARTSPATATSGARRLDDPEKLRRFVSFVNAPGAPDPTVKFVPERGQIKPLLEIGPLPAHDAADSESPAPVEGRA